MLIIYKSYRELVIVCCLVFRLYHTFL